jgi:hypothetical protein
MLLRVLAEDLGADDAVLILRFAPSIRDGEFVHP